MGYPDECGDRDEAPLSHQALVDCDRCGREFTAVGTHTPASLEQPSEFDTDETLCEECRDMEEDEEAEDN